MLEKRSNVFVPMYHNYEIVGIGSKPGSEVVTQKSLVEERHWKRSINGGPGKLLSVGEVEHTTGIRERRIARWNETTTSLAIAASQDALGATEAEKIGLLIVNTSSPERPLPGIAPAIIQGLGAVNADPYDVRQACAAIPYMLKMAIPMLGSGIYGDNEALLISSDTLSRVTDFDDYTTGGLFSDAAGALRLRRSNTKRLAYFELTSAGELAELLKIDPGQNYMSMNGLGLYEEILKRVPSLVQNFFNNTGLTMKDIDFAVLHPGSGKMQKNLIRELHIPHDKTLSILHDHGNSSASSTIGVLKAAHESGRLGTGKKILLVGFGAGIEIGIGVIEWSMPNPHESQKPKFYLIELGRKLSGVLGKPFRGMTDLSIPIPQ